MELAILYWYILCEYSLKWSKMKMQDFSISFSPRRIRNMN